MIETSFETRTLQATGVVACGMAVVLLLWFRRTQRQPFFVDWVRGYVVIWFTLALDFVHLISNIELILPIGSVLPFVSSYLFLKALFGIRSRPVPPWLPQIAWVPLLLLLLRLLGLIGSFGMVAVAVSISAVCTSAVGGALVQTAREENTTSHWVGIPFFVKGLWIFAYPFLARHHLSPLGYWVDGLLHICTAIGMMVFVLERNNQELTVLVNETPGHAFFKLDHRGVITDWNIGAERLFGFAPAEAVGRMVTLLLPAGDSSGPTPPADWESAMAAGDQQELDVWLATRSGQRRWCRTSSARVTGHLLRTSRVVIVQDITDRRAVETEMRNLATAVRQSTEATLLADAQGLVQYANPAFHKLTGLAPPDILGRPLDTVGCPDGPGWHDTDPLRTSILEGKAWSGRITGRTVDGDATTEEASLAPLRDDEGTLTGFLLARNDITEQLTIRERLRHAQKLEAFGRLTAGVAHDFGNILTIVAAQNFRISLAEGDRKTVDEATLAIERVVERASMLIRQLLLFSRRTEARRRVIDANSILRDSTQMLSRVVGEELQLIIQTEARSASVLMDPGHLDQVIVNLVLNARDALGGRGVVRVSTRVTTDEPEAGAAEPAPRPAPGGWFELTVSDNGPGMSAAQQARIFEPFFTTKSTGTGLGLSIVDEIVRETGGSIRVRSSVGQGATFIVQLPLSAESVDEARHRTRLAVGGRSGTILLVEDEATLLQALAGGLRNRGFQVLTAGDPEEALRVAAAHAGTIDLLVTDMSMPHGSGSGLARQLLQARPGVKVLFMSGYSDDTAIRSGDSPLGEFIPKPFLFEDLARLIDRLTGRAGTH